jgi:hypothetical protein
MKSITALAVIGLLFFAGKLCNSSGDSTGNSNQPTSASSPSSPGKSFAKDYIKPQYGRFRLSKSFTKEEARKTALGFTGKMLDQSHDAAAGEYTGGIGTVALMVCAYSSPSVPESLIEELERQIKGDRGMTFVRAIPDSTGKRVEATDSQGKGVIGWSNGNWFFMAIGGNLSDTTALANSIGF